MEGSSSVSLNDKMKKIPITTVNDFLIRTIKLSEVLFEKYETIKRELDKEKINSNILNTKIDIIVQVKYLVIIKGKYTVIRRMEGI